MKVRIGKYSVLKDKIMCVWESAMLTCTSMLQEQKRAAKQLYKYTIKNIHSPKIWNESKAKKIKIKKWSNKKGAEKQEETASFLTNKEKR